VKLTIEHSPIKDIVIVKPEVFEDDRGFFFEAYRKDQFKQLGLPNEFVQLNHSRSNRNVLRGLHFQWAPPMGKLMRVIVGEAFLVAVDIRIGSPTFGQYFGCNISAENKLSVWAPAGFARGFCVLSEFAEVQYLTTGVYNGNCESGIAWDDPDIGINWPVSRPLISEKDSAAQSLSAWSNSSNSNYFHYLED